MKSGRAWPAAEPVCGHYFSAGCTRNSCEHLAVLGGTNAPGLQAGMQTGRAYNAPVIVRRISRGLFTAILAVALLSLPVVAIYATNLASREANSTDLTQPTKLAPAAPLVDSQAEPATAEHHREEHPGGGGCRGLQMAYWRLSSNPGEGEGKAEALDGIVAKADERGCTLAEGDAFSHGRPPWAGGDGDKPGNGEGRGRPPWAEEGNGPPWGPPPWAGKGDDDDAERGKGRGGPRWSRDGDGPPWGLAWGYWLKHGGADAFERIASRLENKPDAVIPQDLRGRIRDELGCSLP